LNRPKNRFQKVEDVTKAAFARSAPSFAQNDPRPRGLRRKGVLFEREVQKVLCAAGQGLYFPSPWIIYRTAAEPARDCWCQPDGLLFRPIRGQIYIIECKLSHTAEAWWQLREVYEPVLSAMFPKNLWDLRFVEVVRWYNPDVWFPGRHYLRKRITQVERGETGVVIWSKRRQRRRKTSRKAVRS
jgi:hypothetical protein